MKTFFRSSAFSVLVSGIVLFAGCTIQNNDVQGSSVSQTQQGIRVGLSVTDPSQFSQQPVVKQDMKVTVMSPDLSQTLKSPITIHGKVSGLFFSEGVFPVVLRDAQGNELARALAHADDEWMTEDDVAFTVELVYKAPANTQAKLVFSKDNPSGLPQNDLSQVFNVTLQ